jgi:hypothetical protein
LALQWVAMRILASVVRGEILFFTICFVTFWKEMKLTGEVKIREGGFSEFLLLFCGGTGSLEFGVFFRLHTDFNLKPESVPGRTASAE